MKLQREASRSGGKVIAMVGNHEAMNMTGDLRYVHPANIAPSRVASPRRVAIESMKPIARRLRRV
jgi:hypothetical protein